MATLTQIRSALVTAREMDAKAQEFNKLVTQINALAEANWTVRQVVGGLVVTLTVSAQDQANLIAQYETAKNDLQTTFQLLP